MCVIYFLKTRVIFHFIRSKFYNSIYVIFLLYRFYTNIFRIISITYYLCSYFSYFFISQYLTHISKKKNIYFQQIFIFAMDWIKINVSANTTTVWNDWWNASRNITNIKDWNICKPCWNDNINVVILFLKNRISIANIIISPCYDSFPIQFFVNLTISSQASSRILRSKKITLVSSNS